MIHRRQFVAGATATFAATALPLQAVERKQRASSLIPSKKSTAPNYWCSWAAQNYLHGQGAAELDPAVLEGSGGAVFAQNLLNEHILLGPGGWAETFHPAARGELYLVLDDGWEEGGTASFELHRKKFPSFANHPPEERLRLLNEAVRAKGWRSLALWCRATPGGDADERLVGWSKTAGIPYWKIDGGDKEGSVARARAKLGASLTLEHIQGEWPVNGEWRTEGRFGPQGWDSPRVRILRNTDVYRVYDATAVLGIPTTLDRAAEMLRGAAGHPEARALLNVEDEVVIAAVLGCTMGVMRHPLRGLRPREDADVFLPAPRNLKQRMDEVTRAMRWQRIAAPYAAGSGGITLDDAILTDEWHFRRGDTFMIEAVGQTVRQGAPARIARNMELPDVRCEGAPPFVFCARFPVGAAAIGTAERVSTMRGVYQPRADIRWQVGKAPGPFGIFGHFASLTILLDRPIKRGRIWAQDLAGETPVDISDHVHVRGHEIMLPGALIDRIGRAAATAGDLSVPGLVIEA